MMIFVNSFLACLCLVPMIARGEEGLLTPRTITVQRKTLGETGSSEDIYECDGTIDELEKLNELNILGDVENYLNSTYSVVNHEFKKNCRKVTSSMKPHTSDFNEFVFSKEADPLISRSVRQTATCVYPTNLKTSDVFCTSYPSKIKCIQKCIFGYTLKEGITRKMECKHDENQWKIKGFEECEPFVDCTMTLISTGKLICISGTTKLAPSCSLVCERYEDKPATHPRIFICRISGGWSKKLPFCAISGSGRELAPAPKIKLHAIHEI